MCDGSPTYPSSLTRPPHTELQPCKHPKLFAVTCMGTMAIVRCNSPSAFRHALCWGLVPICALLLLGGARTSAELDLTPGDRLFREKIEPVFQSECYRCHSEKAEQLN